MSDVAEREAEIRGLLLADLFDGSSDGEVTMTVDALVSAVAEIVVEHYADTELDVDRLANALAGELHVDEAHGFPPNFTARDLAVYVALEYHRLSVES